MRLGLIGQVRRVWVPPKVEVRQAVPYSRVYTYVAVAIDPLTGRLWWAPGRRTGRGRRGPASPLTGVCAAPDMGDRRRRQATGRARPR